MKRPGELRGLAFDIGSVLECDVLVLDVTGQVHVDGAQRSRIFIGPCEGSVFIRDCSDCIFTVAWCVLHVAAQPTPPTQGVCVCVNLATL